MATSERMQRVRADREQRIITAAREMAEAEGWDAVTTRRLAERVGYSQPVLYGHFTGKDAIMAAVAVEGFTVLAAEMSDARLAGEKRDGARGALTGISRAYLGFADNRPALYEAMFSRELTLPFATPDVPASLQAGFDELVLAVRPIAGADDEQLLAETLWAGLHGLATLTRGGRLPRPRHEERLNLLISRFLEQ